jgi:hypothetical protein
MRLADSSTTVPRRAAARVEPLRRRPDRRRWVRVAALLTLVLFVVFLVLRRGRLW